MRVRLLPRIGIWLACLATGCGGRATTDRQQGPEDSPERDAPPGVQLETLRFSKIVAGADHYCGLTDPGGWLACVSGEEVTELVQERFVDLSLSDDLPTWRYRCAVRASGELDCAGLEIAPPAGKFTRVSVGLFNACAVGERGGIHCWVPEAFGGTDSEFTLGQPRELSVSMNHGCAADASGHTVCFGTSAMSPPDELHFHQLAVSPDEACGIAFGGDSSIWCWSDDKAERKLTGTFLGLSVHTDGGCAVTTGGEIQCWGKGADFAPGPAAAGPFQSISVSSTQACALTADKTVLCWKASAR